MEPAGVLLAGPAGVGKSRLATEVAKQLGGLGFSAERLAVPSAAAPVPFGPFAPFLPDSGHVPGDMLGLLTQTRAAITERAGPLRRLLLLVDDAHNLDPGSAALVHQLVATGACSVLATVRTPDPAPEAVTALWKDGLAQRVELGPFDEPATQAVLSAFLGAPVTGATARRFWEISEGNALFLHELLLGAVGSGTLVDRNGIWSLCKPLAAPERLVELVASRLHATSQDVMGVLELLAAGEPLGMSFLERLADMDAVEAAERLRLVEVREDGRRVVVSLAHPVYGEVLRQQMPRSRSRRLFAVLASALEATGGRRRGDLLRLARWQLESGAPSNPALLVRAAMRANEVRDFELGARLARRALELGGSVEAGVRLGEANFKCGRHEEAESVFASLVPLCTNDSDRALLANARVYNLGQLLGDKPAATAVLDEALASATEAEPRHLLLGQLATTRLMAGEPEEALVPARELMASSDDRAVARGCYVGSMSLALLGRTDEAIAVSSVGCAARDRLDAAVPGNQALQARTAELIGTIMAKTADGELEGAEADALSSYHVSVASADQDGQATHLLLRGIILVEQGRLADACRVFLEGATINRDINDLPALWWCTAGLALAEGMAGRSEAAAAAAAEVARMPGSWMHMFAYDLVGRGLAWAKAAAGEMSAAREVLRDNAQAAAAVNQRIAEARLLHDIARLGNPSSVAPRLAELAGLTTSPLVAARARHALAAASASASELEGSAEALETLGASLLAAEAWLAASQAHRSRGSIRSANAASRRAGGCLVRCGDVRTPALVRGEEVDRLTPREREVAALAAAGNPSREIAEKLFLSVRTVDNHIQSAYYKLGVTSRDGLAAALGASQK
jgi:DNA-binding CsgD family transcriptional regulator/DNA polymerase III delta prime subunit